MRLPAFECRVPGKFVLAGEHSVLRGGAAVVLPHPEAALSLKFFPSDFGELKIDSQGGSEGVHALVDKARELARGLGVEIDAPVGELKIESSIPVGSGFGSSAALCVSVTKWFSQALALALDPLQAFSFARCLENQFHGTSSGMDVAAVMAESSVFFRRGEWEPIPVSEMPRFTFHDTGVRAKTSECVSRVFEFVRTYPEEAWILDERMSEASRRIREGLSCVPVDLDQIALGMQTSQRCFEAWGLLPPEALALSRELLEKGALAVKLTGSGGGGFLVGLWERAP
ncbi:hypothetical protein WDW86_11220 [Bdellovibrionota bacterium FG-2]